MPMRSPLSVGASSAGCPRPAPINQVWGLDLTGKQDVPGTVHAILGLIDQGSRRLLAMGRHGIPQALRTDNDRVFTGRIFRWGLALAGVRHQRTTPGCPWQNGRIERLFLTLKSELNAVSVHSGHALASMLGSFAFWYNEVRPHQHLGGATPMEAWRGIDPFQSRPRQVRFVSFWEGRLRDYVMRR